MKRLLLLALSACAAHPPPQCPAVPSGQGMSLRYAREVIARAPDNYQGYRVAADYYRMREHWADFDAALAKLTALNPSSNGLLFLRGVSALYREGDVPKADQLFRQALEKDPKF